MEKEIDFSNKLEILKRSLQACPDYTPLNAFRTIERYNDSGVINVPSLSYFLRQYSRNYGEIELLAIIRRIDTNGNATIDP